MNKTKEQIEDEISEAVIKFEKEYMGYSPLETRAYIINDFVLVHLKGVITRAEHLLATSEKNPGGRELIKKVRIELLEKGRPLLEAMIHSIT